MPRQVDGQHITAMVCQVTALQDPDTVIMQNAMNEDHRGLGRIRGLAPGIGVKDLVGQLNVHDAV
jgi:hypothetical protein